MFWNIPFIHLLQYFKILLKKPKISEPSNDQQPSTTDLDTIRTTMKQLLLVKAFKPDRFISVAERFVASIFGEQFLQQPEKLFDFANIVANEMKPHTPVLMCSVLGYEVSGRVEELAAELSKPLVSIAIGSTEGFEKAENAINASPKLGHWVLLKNVHLAPQWLVQLEKKLHNLQPHSDFRLFLSMEINPSIPSNLLKMGRALVFEPPPGMLGFCFETNQLSNSLSKKLAKLT